MGRTDFAGGVGHRADDFCGRQDHRLELRNGDTREDADEELAFESLLHPGLAEDNLRQLGLAATRTRPAAFDHQSRGRNAETISP